MSNKNSKFTRAIAVILAGALAISAVAALVYMFIQV